jgi:hypothetical protein
VPYFKWAVFSSVLAFIISAGLGVISGVTFVLIIARAIVFAAFFFGLGFALRFLVTNYFPELFLARDTTENEYSNELKSPAENTTVDTTGEYAVPELYNAPGAENELGNIDDLISGAFSRARLEGVDRMEEEGYNGTGVQSEMEMKFKASSAGNQEIINFQDMFSDDTAAYNEPGQQKTEKQRDFTPSLGNDSDDLGGLPDLDSMAMAFGGASSFSDSTGISSFDDAIETAGHGNIEPEESRYTAGNKPQPLKGDFNPKELAKGISTVLAKDK